MSNSAVALMRRRDVRQRLQSELAALPRQPVSYEELLSFFIEFGCKEGVHAATLGHARWDNATKTAVRLAVDLLPQLAPDNPRLRFLAASASGATLGAALHGAAASRDSQLAVAAARTRHLAMVQAALSVALQQGSDVIIACCGYLMAVETDLWVIESTTAQGVPPPSAVLGWLQLAEAAQRRCKAMLPKHWTSELDDRKAMALPAKPWLQHLQQQGDRWRRLTPAAQREIAALQQRYHMGLREDIAGKKQLTCSGCGNWAPQLRTCSACREAQYCR